MVVVGFAVTVAPVVADKPVAGLHVYVVAPLAVSDVLLPLQIVAVVGETVTVGFGFTVTVTVVVDVHEPAVAVIVNVVVCAVAVVLVRVPLIDAPLPLAAIPVRFAVLFLVQLNVVPATAFGFVISICVIAVPEQIVCDAGVAFTVGVGLTVMVAVAVLLQLPAVAVKVNVVV